METPSSCSGDARMTRDVNDRERKLIRESTLPHKHLAKIFHLTEKQVAYIRSREAMTVSPAKKAWSGPEEEMLHSLYRKKGWEPAEIADMFPDKTYNQVYRKMVREFKGR